MKQIINAIINFFKLLFTALISPFTKDKKGQNENTNNTIKSEKINQTNKQNNINATAAAGAPNSDGSLTNPHANDNDEGNIESTRIYSLPRELGHILNQNETYTYLAFSDEKIDELIDKEIEDIYKEKNFKVYKADIPTKKVIEKLKKEIVPKIKDKIYYNNITDEKELKNEIKEIVKEQLVKTPIFPEIKIKQEPYFMATPTKKKLNLSSTPPKVNENTAVINIPDIKPVEKKLEMPSTMMVQNTSEIKEPTVLTELPKIVAIAPLVAAKEVIDVISADDLPKLKDNVKKEEKKDSKSTDISTEEISVNTTPEEISVSTTPEEQKEIATEVDTIVTETEEIIKEADKLDVHLDEVIKEEEKSDEAIDNKAEEVKKEVEEEKEETKKTDIILDMSIDSLDYKSAKVISEAKAEADKSDFFNKDYENEAKRIDKMLDKISDTRIKYDGKLTPKQKERLDKQEAKLRSTKNKLEVSKEKDIAFETRELNDAIRDDELAGLQHEIEGMHLTYKEETNNNLLKRMDKLEGMTKEQVAAIDRKILMNRFNKTSFLLEMTSLLAFPFVRNKYFRLFTIGLVVDNHLGFAHAFLNRKNSRYQPVDLEAIQKGQDALNSSIDLAYKDLIELDYIEEQALSKYPGLANDPAYQASVQRIRNNLTNQLNKLQHKEEVMDMYMHKGKRQKKVLQRMETAA